MMPSPWMRHSTPVEVAHQTLRHHHRDHDHTHCDEASSRSYQQRHMTVTSERVHVVRPSGGLVDQLMEMSMPMPMPMPMPPLLLTHSPQMAYARVQDARPMQRCAWQWVRAAIDGADAADDDGAGAVLLGWSWLNGPIQPGSTSPSSHRRSVRLPSFQTPQMVT